MNTIIIVILITFNLYLVVGNYTSFFKNEDTDYLTKYVSDVIDFVSKTHHGGYINIVFNNGSDHMTKPILEHIHKNMISKIIILNTDNNQYESETNQMKSGNSYLGYLRLMLILTDTTQNVVGIINKLNGTTFYQTRSRMLIVITSTPQTNDLNKMFKFLWLKKYPLVTCMFLDQKQLKIYSFNPFFDEFLQDHSSKNVSNLFYNIFQNINGKKINTLLLKFDDRDKIIMIKHPNGTVKWDGYEINLLRNVIYKMNGTIEIIPASFYILPGERDPWRQANDFNSTPPAIEIKKRIITTKQIDLMSSEEIIIADDLSGVTESLYPHAMDDLKVLMKRAEAIPYYRYLFLVYNYKVWYLYIATIVIATVGWSITGSRLYPSWINKLINLIRVLIGSSLPRISGNNAERVFITVLLFFSLIMSTAFTCNLTTVLMQNKYYPNVDTLDELLNGGYLVIGYGTQIRDLKEAFYNTPKYPLFERMVPFPDKYAHVDTTKNNITEMLLTYLKPKLTVLVNDRRAVYVTKHKVFKDMFHIVKESPLPNYTGLHVPIGSPYFDYINLILRKIIESGLYYFWIKQHDHYYLLKNFFFKPDEADDVQTQANPITINHLQASFFIYAIGIIGSLIAFIIELIISKVKKKLSQDRLICTLISNNTRVDNSAQ